MKVRNLVAWSGLDFSYGGRDVIDLPDDVARARAKEGLVELLEGGVERVVRRRGRGIRTTAKEAPESRVG